MPLALAGCSVDLRRGVVTFDDGSTAHLTDRESRMLAYLAERPGVDVARDDLLTDVWDYAPNVVSRAPDHAMKRLRLKIERDPKHPEHLLTVHGVGYRFEPLDHAPAEPEAPATRGVLRYEGCTLDLDRLRVRRGDQVTPLTGTEAGVLGLLRDRGVVPREVLARELWGRVGASRAVDACLSRLRSKLGPGVLVSQRGVGVALAQPVDPRADDPDFVGRQAPLEEIRSAFARGALLITILGPGGIGKSTLARHAAPDAVWIDLVGAPEGTDLLDAMCGSLGVPIHGDPQDRRLRLHRVLGRHGCAVIDNCEPFRDRLRDVLPELLDAGCTVLATSRVALGLSLEHRVELDRLDGPAAIRLFRRRVGQACAGRPPELVEADVRTLVEALDGIPLAIELAAARTPVMSPRQLIDRLDLDLLRKGEGRHGTMRAVVQGSWDLLPPEQQRALALLARLPAGFTLERVEAIGLEGSAVELLAGLRDASLLRSVGTGRLAPFAPVRELALEEPVPREALERLVRAFAVLGEPQHLAAIGTRGGRARIDELRSERANLEAVLSLAREVAPGFEAPLVLAVTTLAAQSGPARWGVEQVRLAIAGAPPALRRRLHLESARCHMSLNDLDSAEVDLRAALDSSDPGSEARARASFGLARVQGSRHDFASAHVAWTTAATAAREAHRADLAALCQAMAAYYPDLDVEGSLDLAERAVDRAAAGDDLEVLARAAVWHGKLCWYSARWAEARRSLGMAIDAADQIGAETHRARAANALISAKLECGDLDGVEDLLDWGLELGRRTGDANQEALMHLLRGMARLATDDVKQAEIELSDAREACAGLPILVRWATWMVTARLWLRLGDVRSAEHAIGRAIDGFTGAGLQGHLGTALLVRARVLAQRADLDGARGILAEARPLVVADGGRGAIELTVLEGWLDAAAGDRESAANRLDEARRQLGHFGLHSELAPMVRQVRELRRRIGQPKSAGSSSPTKSRT